MLHIHIADSQILVSFVGLIRGVCPNWQMRYGILSSISWELFV